MRRTLDQFLQIFSSLAPSQRITFAVIAVLVPAAFWFLATNGASSAMTPLSYGKVFSLDELRNAEQSLKEAGLNKFRAEGHQLLAPASDVDKYNAALLQSGSLPSHWAEELEKKLESTNPFMTSSETLKQMRETLLGKHLRQMIRGSSDFEDVEVIWTPSSSPRSRFSKDARMKATVFVKTRNGRDLGARQIQALRDAVAFAVPDLNATDVTVYDQRKGEAYTPDREGDPLGNKVLSLLRDYSQSYERKIKDALVHISPEMVVTVNVEIDPLQRSVTQIVKYDSKKSIDQQITEQKRKETYRQQPFQAEPGTRSNQPRALVSTASTAQDRSFQDETSTTIRTPGGETTYTEMVPTLPKVVTVSVLIPESYYVKALELQKVNQPATKTGAGGKTIEKLREETELAVKNIVASAIPNGDPKNINVNSYVPMKEDVPDMKPTTVETVMAIASQWGGAVALGLFAIWALWMLRGSRAKPVEEATTLEGALEGPAPPSSPVRQQAEEPPPPIEHDPVPTLNDRDVVQSMVRENPEMAVAIIGKWLHAAR
jgi:flagellar biosynthesis/type III secretory pathway M-ring protein FliF/YscJ